MKKKASTKSNITGNYIAIGLKNREPEEEGEKMNNNVLLVLLVVILFFKFVLIGVYNIKKECYNSFKKEEKENELFKKIERMRV